MSKKVIAFIALFFILCGVVIGYVFLKNRNLQETSVALKWLHQAQFAGMYVADTEGVYRRRGLDVSIQEFNFAHETSELLLNGEVDFAMMSAEEFVLLADAGEDVLAVASVYQISPYTLAYLNDAGIDSPADFVGRTLGVKGGKVEEELIYLILMEQFGISQNQVVIKTLGFDQRELDDLVLEDADIVGLYRTDQLYFFEQEGVEYSIMHPERFGAASNNDFIVTTGALAQEQPGLVKDFVRATMNGWGKAINDPELGVQATMKFITSEDYNNEEYQQFILNNSIPLIQPNSTTVLGEMTTETMHRLESSMIDHGFVSGDFDLSNYYTNEFLR